MSLKVMVGLAVISFAVAIIQKTSLAFLKPGLTDFVWGLAIGITIGVVATWLVRPRK